MNSIGYYLPARRKRNEAERAALENAAARLQEMMEASSVTREKGASEPRYL